MSHKFSIISILATALIVFFISAYTKPAKKEKVATEISRPILMRFSR